MMSARITLTVTEGILEGKEYSFAEQARCIVGRAEDCSVQLPMDYAHSDVSRHHCVLELEIDPPGIRVRDLGSRNGTYVNGAKIGQRPGSRPLERADLSDLPAYELQDGDEVRVGHTVFRVGIGTAAAALEPAYCPKYWWPWEALLATGR
jgi:pSer/pThr/pTyr-binding forkhead associated (FHA) protein